MACYGQQIGKLSTRSESSGTDKSFSAATLCTLRAARGEKMQSKANLQIGVRGGMVKSDLYSISGFTRSGFRKLSTRKFSFHQRPSPHDFDICMNCKFVLIFSTFRSKL